MAKTATKKMSDYDLDTLAALADGIGTDGQVDWAAQNELNNRALAAGFTKSEIFKMLTYRDVADAIQSKSKS